MSATLPLPAFSADEPTVRLNAPRPGKRLPPLKKILFWALVSLTLIASFGLLWFLYQKTQSASPALRAAVDTELRQMRQLDSDWNVDILRSKVGLNDSYDAIVLPLRKITEGRLRLEKLQVADDPEVKAVLEAMKKVFAQKADVVDEFKSHNSILRNSLRYLPTAATEAHSSFSAARVTGPGSKPTKASEVETLLDSTLSEALKYAVVADDAQREQLLAVSKELEQALETTSDDASAKEAVGVFLNHVKTILRQKANEENLLAGLAKVPTVAAIDKSASAFDGVFAKQQADTEFWRTALFGYSAFLLALVAFIGWRLRQSYVEINRVNTALVESNDGLELRVRERTQELDNALKSLRESETQLIQSEKMSSLGQMIAGVAHEINTPLAYVRSSLETVGDSLTEVDNLVKQTSNLLGLMAAPQPDPDQLSASFATISSLTATFTDGEIVEELRKLSADGLYGIDQISEIVTNLRNFSRLDRSKTTLFDLREGLDSTLVIARNTVKQHKVIKRYADIPEIVCSPSQLNQVFLNLISNAAQALPVDGGTITLATAIDGDTVRVDIADNGSGIAPEHLEKIFDPFFTTKDIGKGTGLGLSIAYKIVEEHSGRIKVQSALGQGTVFSIYLPLHSQLESRN